MKFRRCYSPPCWTPWSSFTPCSRTCGSVAATYQIRLRQCRGRNLHQPEYNNCVGQRFERRQCNSQVTFIYQFLNNWLVVQNFNITNSKTKSLSTKIIHVQPQNCPLANSVLIDRSLIQSKLSAFYDTHRCEKRLGSALFCSDNFIDKCQTKSASAL